MASGLENIKHIVLDMDGTIYLGGTLFPTTLPFLRDLKELGIGFTFVTNNNLRDRNAYARRLGAMGIDVGPERIYTSAHATIDYLQSTLGEVRRLFVVGTQGLIAEFEAAGFECDDDHPDAVVVAFDTQVTYERLSRAAYWVSQSLPYIATHPDRICPTDQATVLPDCGAFCALLEAATGRAPDAIPGKPNALMLEGVRRQVGDDLAPDEIAVVGDRVYTDMRMARDAGAMAILTLTGETTADDLPTVVPEHQPDLVVTGLDMLAQQLRLARAGVRESRSA
jgi:HAD superfamily hydrolase (TIGR01450 family)